jgi:signal transduction histidine kinase
MKNMSFQQRLIIGVLILTAAVTVSLGVVGGHLSSNFMKSRFRDRMEFLAQYLALNAELGILVNNREMLNDLAAHLVKEKDVVRVVIKDVEGCELVSSGTVPDDSQIAMVVKPVMLSSQGEDSLFMQEALDKRLGSVEVIYSTAGINELLRELRNRFVIVAIALSTVGVAGFFVFSRSLISQLQKLVETTMEVSGGNLDVRVEPGSLPETRKLARAFNEMLVDLANSRRELEVTYQEMIQQRAMAETGQFSMTIAHEFKNPLGIIKGALDILKQEDIAPDMRRTMVEYVEDEVMRLNTLVQNFLDFARPRRLEFEPVEMSGFMNDIVKRMTVEWEGRGIELELEIRDEMVCSIDREMFSMAVMNIIKNACEACGEKGRVRITLSDIGGRCLIAVSDTGPGIPEAEMDKIFKPFFTTKNQGSGLGLAFVKRVVEGHSGTIEPVVRMDCPGAIFEIRIQTFG